MKYDVVIGIEIHCELKTKSKMFSNSPCSFGEEANTCVNEIDLGHPGTLPTINKNGVKKALQACIALNCSIDPLVRFDRKNYYYSDLPKGFQITQQFHPIGSNGYIDIETSVGSKRVRINRIHMEEDTAKQFHLSNETLIDFNRSGTPLIEIVSEADMTSSEEAVKYLQSLQEILYYLGVSDVKMEEGSMRCDINISLKPQGSSVFGTKNEIKNLNSLSNVEKAIEYEIERQRAIYDEGGTIEQCTRRFDEATKTTVLMRLKEGAVDYKYFPEPNIFPIQLDTSWIDELKVQLPELPQARRNRFKTAYGLNEYDCQVLVATKEISDYFEQVMSYTTEAKAAANMMLTDVLAWLNKKGMKINELPCQPENLARLISMISQQVISGKQAKELFDDVMNNKNPEDLATEKGMKQVSDVSFIEQLINDVLDEQTQSIEDYKNGKDRALGFLVGQVMKKSKGQANPALTNKMLTDALKKRIN